MSGNVAKFGGTSMAQPAVMADLLMSEPELWPYVVVSAPGTDSGYKTKVTDHLITLAGIQIDTPAWHQQAETVIDRFDEIYRPHLGKRVGELHDRFHKLLEQNRYRTRVLPALGEAASAYYFAEMLGVKSLVPMLDESLEFRDFPIQLDRQGSVDYRRSLVSIHRLKEVDGPVVIPGFFGFDSMGNVYPLPRGGSDRTGGIVSGGLNLPYHNFTDVQGIFAADPRIVDSPRQRPNLTYRETREAAVGGSGVLEGNTIADIMTLADLTDTKGVTIYVRDSFHPDGEFTTIRPYDKGEKRRRGVQLISARVLTSLTVYDPSSADISGWIASLTASMQPNLSIEHTLTGRDGVTFFVDAKPDEVRTAHLSMRAVGSQIARVGAPEACTVITVVGEDLSDGDHSRYINRATRALGTAGVKTITTHHHPHSPSIVISTHTSGSNNGVPQLNRDAVRTLYDTFLRDRHESSDSNA